MPYSKTLYQIDIPIPAEYGEMVHDALRLIVIQFTMYFMYFISSSSASFVNYAVMQLFMLVGLALYWLVFRKLINFDPLPLSDKK